MNGSYDGNLRLWQGWTSACETSLVYPASGHFLTGPHWPREFADRLYAWEALNPAVSGPHSDDGAEPYTLQWFLNIENQRHSRQGRWIPHLLEFARHAGETLLGLGTGLGTDWLQYARHGADVVVCAPSAEQLSLVRRNFELRGLAGRFLHAPAVRLPLESCSIDVACVSGVLHEVGDPHAVVEEIYRVLKPGGKVLAVTPARYDISYWRNLCVPLDSWLWSRPAELDDGMHRLSGRGLKQLFGRYIEHRIYKRQLRRSETPYLWRCVPMPILERLFGHVLVLKAFKPLSAAISHHDQAAA